MQRQCAKGSNKWLAERTAISQENMKKMSNDEEMTGQERNDNKLDACEDSVCNG